MVNETIKNQIETQLDELSELEITLQQYLEDEEYDLFEQQQGLFSKKIKRLIETNSQEILSFNIDALKDLQSKVTHLQSKSKEAFDQLKQESLKHKRTKKKPKSL